MGNRPCPVVLRAAVMHLVLPFLFLLLQGILLALPAAISAPVAYLAMTVAPLLASLALLVRAHREAGPPRIAWRLLALALAVWSLGAFGNLWQEWVLGRSGEMYREAILCFNLATVPTAYLLASDWREGGRRVVRVIDAGMALALGITYFLFTWTLLTSSANAMGANVSFVVWMLDALNVLLAAGACLRWHVAQEAGERQFFGVLSIHMLVYAAIVFINDHYFGPDPDKGPEWGSVISLSFALLAAMALRRPQPERVPPGNGDLARIVRAVSPIVLAGAVLIVSLFLVRIAPTPGTAGILVAVLGYGVRNAVLQAHHIQRGDSLQRRSSELQAIAWTDALTGVANRRYLDQALQRAWRNNRRTGRAIALLMIDVDHFKLLNDRNGHPAGDACLRQIAQVMQRALVRSDDVLARYGGEEFIALLRDVDRDGAVQVAERLRRAVHDLKVEHEGSPHGFVTVSIGVAGTAMQSRTRPERLIEAADRALYAAKCAGRDRVQVEQAIEDLEQEPGEALFPDSGVESGLSTRPY